MRRIAIGAVLAAALGSTAGAALRPEPGEQAGPVAPQQIYLDGPQLAAAEWRGGGWPARDRS